MTCLLCGYPVKKLVPLKEILFFVRINSEVVCMNCKGKFTHVIGMCLGCQKEAASKTYCNDCSQWQKRFNFLPSHRALYQYNSIFKEWLELFKFKGYYHLGSIFKEEVKAVLKTYQVDYIVPIPIANQKKIERGYNQVEVILDFAEVAYQTILIKRKTTPAQSAKTKQERLKSAFHFYINPEKKAELMNKHVLLVDDVYTSGSTLQHASLLFYECSVASVQTFSLAR